MTLSRLISKRNQILPRAVKILLLWLSGLRTLRWKLFLSYLLVSIIPMLVLWWNVLGMLEGHLIDERSRMLRSAATQLATSLDDGNYMNDATLRPLQSRSLRETAERHEARIIIVNNMATVIFDSHMAVEGTSLTGAGIMHTLAGAHHSSVTDDGAAILEIAPITDEKGLVLGAVMMTRPVGEDRRLLNTVNDFTLNFVAALAVIVAACVVIISQWFMRPMKRVLTSVGRISEGRLEERINAKGKDEFAALGLAINDMTQKLAYAETARQEFVSNVSHELKTPLSSIKVLCESLLHQEGVENEVYREFLGDITSEVDRMTNIVNELLTLVRLDEIELPLNISQFSLNKMLEEVIKRLRPLALQKEISVDFSAIRQVSIEADEMKISLALTNLIENAIKYNNRGGYVKVILDADNKSAFLTVADNGVGISEENQTKVFGRFFRVDKGRDRETGGTGLGLSITHKTILLHKGSIKLSSKEEEGSTFLVRIPILTEN